jgi:hypothetical protein
MTACPENIHRSRLLHLLRDEGARSRAELGDIVQLSRSKLALELDRLAKLELVEPAGLAASRGGRRSAIVRIASHLRFVGIDIGVTSIDVAVTNGELEVLGHLSTPADVRDGPAVILDQALELLGKLRVKDTATEIHGTGIGLPGPVSFREGMLIAPPIMPGWDRFPVREVMSQELGCPVLGETAGVIGATRLISDHLLSAPARRHRKK